MKISNEDIVDALTDKRCGTYFHKPSGAFIVVAKKDGRYIEIGGYDGSIKYAKDGKEHIRLIEEEIWHNYFFGEVKDEEISIASLIKGGKIEVFNE